MSQRPKVTARKVKAARCIFEWTQKRLAQETNLAVSTIADFERGARDPKPETVDAIVLAFARFNLTFIPGGIQWGQYSDRSEPQAVYLKGAP